MDRVLLLLLPVLLWSPAAKAVWQPSGVDLSRPRLLMGASEIPAVQAKLDAAPLPDWTAAVLARMAAHVAEAESVDLDDPSVGTHRVMGRAARNLAFFYLVDRIGDGAGARPFADEAERAAAGDRAKELLLHLFPRSRLAVPPLEGGGWDRDISTSEELVNWASAYDALAGAGYDFGADEAAIVEGIADVASELYLNYTRPETASGYAMLHQNNHRSKSGAALALAGIALAEYEPAPGTDPEGIRNPALWIDHGAGLVDLIVRVALNTGDGGYAEGPFYFRFTSQNTVPFLRAWDRLLGGASWEAGPLTLPSLWRHPLHDRMQRWTLDMTLPDGSLVHIDDGNPGRSHYFGTARPDSPEIAAYYWRWANAPSPFEVDGNVNLGPDALVLYDPSVVPAPPTGSPTAFYPEAGNAIFRSDWSDAAIMAVALAEYDTASLFGRDRDGRGLGPQGHEHAEPGSFLLHAYGERMALDPGYFSFFSRGKVAQAEHHNLILVDGAGPVGYLGASFAFASSSERPAAEGHARMSDTLDTDFLDAARVTTSYGFGPAGPYAEAPLIERRFLFGDDRYLLVADRVTSRDGAPHELTWLLHGNGGGTDPGGLPGGTYADTPHGGRWERGAARLDTALAVDAGAFVLSTAPGIHESALSKDEDATHVVLRATATGEALNGLMLNYPSPSARAAPTLAALDLPGAAALRLDDPEGDRRLLAWHRADAGDPLPVDGALSGLADASSDGRLALFDAAADGTLRLAHAESATEIAYGGATLIASDRPATLALAPEPGAVHAYAGHDGPTVALAGLGFAPQRVDGACGFVPQPDGSVVVQLNRERRFRLAADAGNARPAADAGPDLRLPLGFDLTLDGRASCDADGDPLTARWQILSAPTQHRWELEDPESFRPRIVLDRPGVYRLALVVTDVHGAESLADEVVVYGGGSCDDGIDDDLDGLIDADDPSCPLGAETVRPWGTGCGLGPGLAPLLWALRRRRRHRLPRGSGGARSSSRSASSASAMPRSPATA